MSADGIILIPKTTYNKFKRIMKCEDSEAVDKEIIKLIKWRIKQLKNTKNTRKQGIYSGTAIYGRRSKPIDVKVMLKLKKKGIAMREIGKQFDVSHTTISRRLKELL